MTNIQMIYLGAGLSVLGVVGSILVIVGNVRLISEITKKQSIELKTEAENITNQFKIISKEQINTIIQGISNEQEIMLIINNLTLPEKWTLIRFIRGYEVLSKEDFKRMVSELNEYYSKSPYENTKDVFKILSMKKLINNKILEGGVMESELTPLGLKVVSLMVKNKIVPFEIVREKQNSSGR